MPYKLREDHNANRAMKLRVATNARLREQGLEPVNGKSVQCMECKKITTRNTPTIYRHYDDCSLLEIG